MPHDATFLAIDLGAESGRAILGTLKDGQLTTEEVHRFANEPVKIGKTLYWDFPRLFLEIVEGIRLAAAQADGHLDGIAVDAWGVDFGLIDGSGELLGLPVHYRDERTKGLLDEIYRRTPREEVFKRTGLQFMEFNTLVQLVAMRQRSPELLFIAKKMLPIADLVSYFLCGTIASERTLASTTQLYDPTTRTWSKELCIDHGIPETLLADIVDPGTKLGPLKDEFVQKCGLKDAPPIIACASHDTASAVAAIPAVGEGPWGYISSGTWSLIGVELPEPELKMEVLAHRFTNEAGAFGTTRFLHIACGLWLLQECKRHWAQEGEDLSYDKLTDLAEASPPAQSWVDLDDPDFFTGGDMPEKIREQLRATGQALPTTRGDLLRCILESLARKYHSTVRSAEELTGTKIEKLHVVGGGSQQRLLNQLTANLLDVPVITGPIEATAMGNLLIQAHAVDLIPTSKELRRVAERSSQIKLYRPRRR